jgi:hypothetical protein
MLGGVMCYRSGGTSRRPKVEPVRLAGFAPAQARPACRCIGASRQTL